MFVMDYEDRKWINFRIVLYQGFTILSRNLKRYNTANAFLKALAVLLAQKWIGYQKNRSLIAS